LHYAAPEVRKKEKVAHVERGSLKESYAADVSGNWRGGKEKEASLSTRRKKGHREKDIICQKKGRGEDMTQRDDKREKSFCRMCGSVGGGESTNFQLCREREGVLQKKRKGGEVYLRFLPYGFGGETPEKRKEGTIS